MIGLARRPWLWRSPAMLLAPPARADDGSTVPRRVRAYRAAVTARNGDAAVNLVTAGSQAHYQRLRRRWPSPHSRARSRPCRRPTG